MKMSVCTGWDLSHFLFFFPPAILASLVVNLIHSLVVTTVKRQYLITTEAVQNALSTFVSSVVVNFVVGSL